MLGLFGFLSLGSNETLRMLGLFGFLGFGGLEKGAGGEAPASIGAIPKKPSIRRVFVTPRAPNTVYARFFWYGSNACLEPYQKNLAYAMFRDAEGATHCVC